MKGRIAVICSHLPACTTFADIGCDHGYCTQYMLERGLCERAYISDISPKCLQKAERLLAPYLREGRCVSVCADGLSGLPCLPDVALIAGMGGEEIVRILKEGGIPPRFVLQPMKNAEKVRAFLVERGCSVTRDFTFADGGYYHLIAGGNAGGDRYSDFELLFGRDNLRDPSPDFLAFLQSEREKLRRVLSERALGRESREEVLLRLERIEEITYAVEDDL